MERRTKNRSRKASASITAALAISVCAYAGFRVALPAVHAAPAATGMSGETIVGGPFDHVVYNVRSHMAVVAPGLFKDGPVTVRAPAIRYDDVSKIASTDGACTITNGASTASAAGGSMDFANHLASLTGSVQFQTHGSLSGGEPMSAGLSCPRIAYHTSAGLVECAGGVQGQIQSFSQASGASGPAHPTPVVIQLACPTLTYETGSGVARCSGGAAGQIYGISAMPGAVLSTVPTTRQAIGAAKPVAPTGPLNVHAPGLTYDSKTKVMQAAGGVSLEQARSTITARALGLDVGTRMLRMTGSVHYTDGEGRQLQGSEAVEDLKKQVVELAGPVTYHDRKGNTVTAESATLETPDQTVTFRGNVVFSDPQGSQAHTPYVSIQTTANGEQRIQTGPLEIHGTTPNQPE